MRWLIALALLVGCADTTAPVVISTQDIPAGSKMRRLADNDVFEVVQVPTELVVDGAFTDLEGFAGLVNTTPIYAGEQVLSQRTSETPGPGISSSEREELGLGGFRSRL